MILDFYLPIYVDGNKTNPARNSTWEIIGLLFCARHLRFGMKKSYSSQVSARCEDRIDPLCSSRKCHKVGVKCLFCRSADWRVNYELVGKVERISGELRFLQFSGLWNGTRGSGVFYENFCWYMVRIEIHMMWFKSLIKNTSTLYRIYYPKVI